VTLAPDQHAEPVVYELDAANVIRHVDGPWDDFAEANADAPGGMTSCLSRNVIDQSIFTFIHDDRTRLFLTTVLDATRLLDRIREVAYRCDSPSEKRYMRMVVEPLPARHLRLTHTLERTETMTRPFTMRVDAPDPANATRRCSVCNRIEVAGAWIEPDHEDTRGLPQPCPVAHTVCPVCGELALGLSRDLPGS
jgi:hypothetical protein